MKKLLVVLALVLFAFTFIGCDFPTTNPTEGDIQNQFEVGEHLADHQPTPTDIDYSLERYNLIKRAYWVNGQRDKANALPCPITDMPIGYVILFMGNSIVGELPVYGKITSLNSWLTPDFYYQSGFDLGESTGDALVEMPDVDGSYGTNSDGIFFFTPQGQYFEWNGVYLYSDYYLNLPNLVITIDTLTVGD